jgi:hypothetical protein
VLLKVMGVDTVTGVVTNQPINQPINLNPRPTNPRPIHGDHLSRRHLHGDHPASPTNLNPRQMMHGDRLSRRQVMIGHLPGAATAGPPVSLERVSPLNATDLRDPRVDLANLERAIHGVTIGRLLGGAHLESLERAAQVEETGVTIGRLPGGAHLESPARAAQAVLLKVMGAETVMGVVTNQPPNPPLTNPPPPNPRPMHGDRPMSRRHLLGDQPASPARVAQADGDQAAAAGHHLESPARAVRVEASPARVAQADGDQTAAAGHLLESLARVVTAVTLET